MQLFTLKCPMNLEKKEKKSKEKNKWQHKIQEAQLENDGKVYYLLTRPLIKAKVGARTPCSTA